MVLRSTDRMNFTSSHKFFTEFKKLENILRKLANVDDAIPFSGVLDKIEEKNSLIKSKRAVLRDLNALRNVFAHSDRDKYIAEVNHLAFDEIADITNLLENPPTVGHIFKKKVFYVSPNDITETVLKEMKNKIYTHIPIYENNKFYGVFSESSLLSWLVDNIHEGEAHFLKMLLKNVKREYLFQRDNIVKFIPSHISIFEIPSMFDQTIKEGNRLGAIIITESGEKDELPIGIITAWDLPKINNIV